MIRATYKDKASIVNILSSAFKENKSVHYIVKQDSRRTERMKVLMSYSFAVCYRFGAVYLSDDKTGCALLIMPDKKKTTLKSVFRDMKLIFSCTGIANLPKAMTREATIKKLHPRSPMLYLWFIGVNPSSQNKGVGSTLLNEIINVGMQTQRPIYLETSTLRNIPWYEKFGFTVYNKLDFGYDLFCMKKEA